MHCAWEVELEHIIYIFGCMCVCVFTATQYTVSRMIFANILCTYYIKGNRQRENTIRRQTKQATVNNRFEAGGK